MRNLGWCLGLVVVLLFWVRPVEANEGRIVLKNGSVECEGVSVWKEGRYRIVGRCSGLVYPYSQKIDRYSLWVQQADGADTQLIDNVEVGFFEGSASKDFTRVFLTAESASSTRNPSDVVIAMAELLPFDFNVSLQPQTQITPLPTLEPTQTPVRIANLSRLWLTVPIVLLFLVTGVVVLIILSRRG